MENNHKGNLPSGAAKAICCRRVPGGYKFFDVRTGGIVGAVCIMEAADDQSNSALRDAVQGAIYQYGKVWGVWA